MDTGASEHGVPVCTRAGLTPRRKCARAVHHVARALHHVSMEVTACASPSVASTSAAPSALSAAGASRAVRHALNVEWSYVT